MTAIYKDIIQIVYEKGYLEVKIPLINFSHLVSVLTEGTKG